MGESYNPQGISNWLWVPSVAGITDPSEPTVTELTHADVVDLGCSVLNPTAPQKQAQTVSATPLCATEERTLPALPTVTPASLELLRADTDDADGFDLFNELKADTGTTGWLVHLLHPSGTSKAPAADDVVDVWPATINAVSVLSVAPGAPATWRVDFSHNGAFHENVQVVAGA